MKIIVFALVALAVWAGFAGEIKLGIVGIDTSHAIEFTKHINVEKDREIFKDFRIVAAYKYGSKSIHSSTNRYPKYEAELKGMGVEMVPSVKDVLAKCDAVLLETNDGRCHLQQAREIFASGKPVFIDKPIAHSYFDTLQILREAKARKAKFFSCSGLRWTDKVQAARRGDYGHVIGVNSFAPTTRERTHSAFMWYGVHGFEPLCTVMGPGADEVTCFTTKTNDVVTVRWKDGRIGVVRGMSDGPGRGYGSMAFTEKGPVDLGGYEGYAPMLEEILKFFRTGVVPYPPEETEEIFAVMAAAEESAKRGGAPVKLDEIRERFAQATGAPGGLNPPDLSSLKIERLKDRPVIVAKGRFPQMPIVVKSGRDTAPAARYLQTVIMEMTGAKLRLIEERENDAHPWTNGPAIFIGDTLAVKLAGLAVDPETKPSFGLDAESFRVLVKGGSVYLGGNAPRHAVADFCERILGVRQYWDAKDGGRSVIRQEGLSVPAVAWTDKPAYDLRNLWPYEQREWTMLWKGGGAHGVSHHVHQPGGWARDTNYNYIVTRPEIFALSDSGSRGSNSLLCYGCPKTLETYLERIEGEIEHGRPAGGIVDMRTKSITVSQADLAVYCNCEHCKAIKQKSGMPADCYSDVMWSHFTKKLARAVKKRWPEWTISILPYKNTCPIPPDLDFTPEGNVECYLCTMSGVAMMKDEETRVREEGLIREWNKRTGRPVLNWHYIIWPCIFTSAPYVFGETIQKHYKAMRGIQCGSFLNGRYDVQRLCVSAYVWLHCLWNPEFSLDKTYDTFAQRMFGPAAKPMREIVAMQERGWNRQWKVSRISNKNVFGTSYPRADVLRMQELFAEARKLAAGDATVLGRIDYYEGGFKQFYKESEEYASGVTFAPLMMEKVSQDPVIDGKLDEDCWQACEDRQFVKAQLDRETKKAVPAEVQTHVKAVWTPQGVTIGIRCDEPEAENVCDDGPTGNYWANDAIDSFIDFGGESAVMAHLILNSSGKLEKMVDSVDGSTRTWADSPNVKYAVYKGNDFWSVELYLPYDDMKGDFPVIQRPTTSGGMFWTGNFSRLRRADKYHKLPERSVKYVKEHSRMNTRGSEYNRNTDAFSKLIFKE